MGQAIRKRKRKRLQRMTYTPAGYNYPPYPPDLPLEKETNIKRKVSDDPPVGKFLLSSKCKLDISDVIPNSIIYLIGSYCDDYTICQLAKVNRKLAKMFTDEHFFYHRGIKINLEFSKYDPRSRKHIMKCKSFYDYYIYQKQPLRCKICNKVADRCNWNSCRYHKGTREFYERGPGEPYATGVYWSCCSLHDQNGPGCMSGKHRFVEQKCKK